jgi:DNA polymerase III delta prime subunit
MTPTEAIYRKMIKRPKSTLLLGGRSEHEFIRTYFSKAQDTLVLDSLVSDEVENVAHFSSLAPMGDYRVVCIKNLCRSRRDIQATLLKLIEESPDRTHWIISATTKNLILEPLISRSFLLDWVQEVSFSCDYTETLKNIVSGKSYLEIFKLHEKIARDADKDLSRVKEKHLACLSELLVLLPAHKSAKVHKARQEVLQHTRTEIAFKSALIEVIHES